MGEISIIVTAPSGGRRHVPPAAKGSPSWSEELMGGYGDFSWPLSCGITELTSLQPLDRVEIWSDATRLYRGYIQERGRQVSAPDKLLLKGYGRMFDLERIGCTAPVFLPSGSDLADVAARIYDLWIAPVLPTSVLLFDAEVTGVGLSRFDPTGKTAKQALDDLCALSGGTVCWGVGVDEATGKDLLYIRLVGANTHVISVPGHNVNAASGEIVASDVINRLDLTGGEMVAWRQNLAPNASFERQVDPGDSDSDGIAFGNLLRNPGFEIGSTHNGSTAHWTLTSGATAKLNGGTPATDPDAFAGSWALELSDSSENATQQVTGLVAGHAYGVRAFLRPSDVFTNANAQIEINWQEADGTPITSDTFDFEVATTSWERFETAFQAPPLTAQATVTLRSQGPDDSIMYDSVSFWDADTPALREWKMLRSGTGVATMDWGYSPAYHGVFCVKAAVTGADTSGSNSVTFTHREQIPVRGGGKYFFYIWLKTTANPHDFKLKLVYQKADGTDTGILQEITLSGSGIPDWDWAGIWATAPSDAVTVHLEIVLRKNGDWFLDAFTLMEDRGLVDLGAVLGAVPGDGTAAYIPDGPLFVTLRAEDLVTSGESAEVNGSYAAYGPRDGNETIESIKSYPDALAFAKSYFLTRAKAIYRPAVTLLGAEKPVRTGDKVRLVGDFGGVMSGNQDLTLARIKGSVSVEGLVSQGLEIGQSRPDLPALLLLAARKDRLRVR